MPQSPFLFKGTVLDNIRYGKPDAGEVEILSLAKQIGSGDWLEALPEGLQTEVGERGSHLSMGTASAGLVDARSRTGAGHLHPR